MKSLNFLILMFTMIILISCDKNDVDGIDNVDVENYIALLKAGQNDSMELPEFTYNDIPALLMYRNEDQIITDFPRNGISSLYGPDCKLGMYVLWTIESIRAVAINSKYLIGRFPSLNPILAFRDSQTLDLVDDDVSHHIAAKAYFDWWYSNSGKDFDAFKMVDPLINTDYRWH